MQAPVRSIWLLFVTVLLGHIVTCCKKKPDPENLRCQVPPVPDQVYQTGGRLTCSGHADRYYNMPKVYDDISKALTMEGGVIKNGSLHIETDLVVPQEDPETSECHLLCSPGYMPAPTSSVSCTNGTWTQDPARMTCIPSPCGAPANPDHGHFTCYGNPSACYLTCDPGYATMSTPVVTCRDGGWDNDHTTIRCEVAVALMTGGIGRAPGGKVFPDMCQTAEVFSPEDASCSSMTGQILKIGVTDHTSHLVDGEILLCGGNECGRSAEKVVSKDPIYKDTISKQSCFKMLSDNSWAFHSQFSGSRWGHMGALQLNKLQLIGGYDRTLDAILKLSEDAWTHGRAPSLPPTVWPTSVGNPCIVVTSPFTFIVTGGSSNQLKHFKHSKNGEILNSALEFNSMTKEWRSLPDIPTGRTDHACALVTTKSGPGVMVAGGKNWRAKSKWPLDTVFILDLGTEKWYPAGKLSHGRESFGLVVLGERVMVLGSSPFVEGSHTSEPESVEEYVVPCASLRECDPSQEGVWTPTDRAIGRRSAGSVLPVPASRFNCAG